MSLVLSNNPIHFPKDPDKFEFDEEVAIVFDNMAKRSIPLYDEVHDLHARLVVEEFKHYQIMNGRYALFNLLDIGASTGRLFKSLYNFSATDRNFNVNEIDLHAIDPCSHMIGEVADRYKKVKTFTMGAADISQIGVEFDVVALHYVLQFIPVDQQEDTLRIIRSRMRPGGMLLFAQKEEIVCPQYGQVITKHYNDFRIRHGYTQQEIDAKTRALMGSMWVDTEENTRELFTRCGFSHIQETMRWGNFSAWVCRTYG